MKVYSNVIENPTRVILPILEAFPNEPILGELIFFNVFPKEGVYLYSSDGWKPLHTLENNIWEQHIAEPEQVIFNLKNYYNTDGKSLVVYKDGIRLPADTYAEVGSNIVAWKTLEEFGGELLGGEIFEFQIFNVKSHSVFDIKAFNRRNG
jgi:hypothetical protein